MKFILPICFDEMDVNDWERKLSMAARLALQIGIDREYFEILAIQELDEPFLGYVVKRYDFLKEEKERNRKRNLEVKNNLPLNGVSSKKHIRLYDRLCTLPISMVLSNIGKSIDLEGHRILITSKRYRCYARNGVTCIRCGIEGHYFAAERSLSQPTERYHLNLYHKTLEGKEIMMTVDHRLPLSRDGEDKVNNLQPMCIKCNGEKGNRTEEELKSGVKGVKA